MLPHFWLCIWKKHFWGILLFTFVCFESPDQICCFPLVTFGYQSLGNFFSWMFPLGISVSLVSPFKPEFKFVGFCFVFSVPGRKKTRNVCQFKIPFLGHPGFSDHKFSLDHAILSDTERRRTSLLIFYSSSSCWTPEDFSLCSLGLQRQQYVSNFAPSCFPNQYAVL